MSTTKKSKTSFPSLKLNNTITANSDNINTNNRPVTYRLVKSYSSIDYSDLSHKQLFYKLSDEYSHDSAKQNIALLNASPTYYREVIKPDERHAKIFWFDAALMYAPGINIVTSSPLLSPAMTYDSRSSLKLSPPPTPRTPLTPTTSKTIWSIEPANLKYSKILGKPRRPKRFTIKYVPTGSASTFKKQTDNESSSSTLEYYGDVNTPFDNTCVQRYKWIKSLDTQKKCKENNHKWIFVACNDPETPLAEFRPTNIENEFDIVFLERAPIGWNPNIADRLSRFSGLSGGRASGFESLDGRESKQSSMYSFTSTISNVKSKQSFPVNSFNILAEDDGRYWQEYILASTVAIQDEVNSRKISFNKRIRNFFG